MALVSLVRSSGDDSQQAGELIEAIRTVIQSSPIGKSWTIDKITILGEPGLTTESSTTNENSNATRGKQR